MSRDPEFTDSNFTCDGFAHPSKPGVYAVIVFEPFTRNPQRVVYIGSSKNMHRRVMSPNHIYRRLNNILKCYSVAVWCFETDNYLSVEESLIKKYRPRFNKQHNA